ncbi:MAG TPA: DUF2934 domain-containing protein [Nitrospiria bacterium]|nr:DUF2934 domain-containing protein [Nitrospiria bacterium]
MKPGGEKERAIPGGASPNGEVLRQRIAKRAYEVYLDRGQTHGHDVDDWLEAEQMVLAEMAHQ